MPTLLHGVLCCYLAMLGLLTGEMVVNFFGLVRDYPRHRLGDFSVIDYEWPVMKARYR